MAQPIYKPEQVQAMTNEQLANHLLNWANARDAVTARRAGEGKTERLDSLLLREAANRLKVA